MLNLVKRLSAATLAPVLLKRAATLTLDWDRRQKSRFGAQLDDGREVAVLLPRGSVLRGGDVLVAEDGGLVRVVAAPQAVLQVRHCQTHGTPFDLLRAAYHLGNRHVPLELQPQLLQLEPDPVLAAMLRAQHLIVSETLAPFEPEAGAYGGVGITTVTLIMTTPTELLQLLWLASPALPVGAFSYSEGLEAAIDAGLVHDEATAGDWLLNQLDLVQARAELPLMAAVLRGGDLPALNAWVLQTRESAELLQQCTQMGRSLAAWMRGQGLAVPALDPPSWPVLYALAAQQRGAGIEATLHAAAFAWSENLVMAAVRGVPLGQSAGQRLIGRLVEAIPAAVQQALAAEEAIAFSPGLAVLSARHETQYSRLFRS